VTFEPARPGDAAAILRIFKETFKPDLLPCVPLGCAGAENYIEDAIATKVPNPDTIWLVARDSSVEAFAECRLGLSSLFFNWLHVAPTAQGKKLGSKLFRYMLETLCGDRNFPISLDVAVSNTRAHAWYQRLSFVDKHTAEWLVFPLHSSDAPPKFLVSVNAFDERMHQTYGFSTRRVETISGTFTIGMLGDQYFRSSDPEDLNRIAILQAIDPKRELLLITSKPVDGGYKLNRLVRMTASTQTVLKNLRSE
jgi:GNAT superfamily N-acetyltransferase